MVYLYKGNEMVKYFYKETGMYIDWKQIEKLPDIDTFIDIGVGKNGSPILYKKFANKQLVLIDPLDEAEHFFDLNMKKKNAIFFKTALGDKTENAIINVENNMDRSTILEVSDINFEGDPIDKRTVPLKRLDDVVGNLGLSKIGIKIDTEGYELNVIKGARKTLKKTKFVLAEVRHNHESFKGVYKMHEFIKEMTDNGFVLTMIITAKPFIADLCFEPKNELFE